MAYHRKDKERVEKVAEILSRYHEPNKEEGEVKADPSIVVTATPVAPKEEKGSNSATLSPKREVVCVSLGRVREAEKKRNCYVCQAQVSSEVWFVGL